MTPGLLRETDQIVAEIERLTERLRELEGESRREQRADLIQRQAATLLRWPESPRRPVAGNSTEIQPMLTDTQRNELTDCIVAELAAVERENRDDALRVEQLERRRDIRRAEAITTTMLTVLQQTFPEVADTIAHAALRSAVALLGGRHGGEFVQARVESILSAKLDG